METRAGLSFGQYSQITRSRNEHGGHRRFPGDMLERWPRDCGRF